MISGQYRVLVSNKFSLSLFFFIANLLPLLLLNQFSATPKFLTSFEMEYLEVLFVGLDI